MDRREYLRFNVNLDVQYRILESLKPYKISLSEDASEKGIKMNLGEYIAPDTRLELIIKLPGESHPIMVIGRVVWVKKDLFNRFFTTGIHIMHVDEKNRQRFYQYAFL